MKIFVYASTFSVYTTSTPMRGMCLELIKLRVNDEFIFLFNEKDKSISHLEGYFKVLAGFNNVSLCFNKYSRKLSNLKALLGFENYLRFDTNADIYISPGTPDFFGKDRIPLINVLADLSQERTPDFTSTPWHTRYIMRNNLKLSIKYSSRVICISDFTRKDLGSFYPLLKSRAITIYNGIKDEWFDNYYEAGQANTIINPNYGYWIWYGLVTKRKNLYNLLKAYQELISEGQLRIPKIILVASFVENQKYLKKYINENLINNVNILSHQEIHRLKFLVKNSKGLLFPSYYEGFGLPIIEAFSQGIPVLHSDTSAMPEIAGGLGVSCNPYSIESIKLGLERLMNAKNDIEIINRRKQWSGKFTYQNAAERFSQVIDDVVNEK